MALCLLCNRFWRSVLWVSVNETSCCNNKWWNDSLLPIEIGWVVPIFCAIFFQVIGFLWNPVGAASPRTMNFQKMISCFFKSILPILYHILQRESHFSAFNIKWSVTSGFMRYAVCRFHSFVCPQSQILPALLFSTVLGINVPVANVTWCWRWLKDLRLMPQQFYTILFRDLASRGKSSLEFHQFSCWLWCMLFLSAINQSKNFYPFRVGRSCQKKYKIPVAMCSDFPVGEVSHFFSKKMAYPHWN